MFIVIIWIFTNRSVYSRFQLLFLGRFLNKTAKVMTSVCTLIYIRYAQMRPWLYRYCIRLQWVYVLADGWHGGIPSCTFVVNGFAPISSFLKNYIRCSDKAFVRKMWCSWGCSKKASSLNCSSAWDDDSNSGTHISCGRGRYILPSTRGAEND